MLSTLTEPKWALIYIILYDSFSRIGTIALRKQLFYKPDRIDEPLETSQRNSVKVREVLYPLSLISGSFIGSTSPIF